MALPISSPTRSGPTRPGPHVAARPSRSPASTLASRSACPTTFTTEARCCRDATSGTTPPYSACTSTCDEITFERMCLPFSITAAAVSSHDVSIPRISMQTPSWTIRGAQVETSWALKRWPKFAKPALEIAEDRAQLAGKGTVGREVEIFLVGRACLIRLARLLLGGSKENIGIETSRVDDEHLLRQHLCFEEVPAVDFGARQNPHEVDVVRLSVERRTARGGHSLGLALAVVVHRNALAAELGGHWSSKQRREGLAVGSRGIGSGQFCRLCRSQRNGWGRRRNEPARRGQRRRQRRRRPEFLAEHQIASGTQDKGYRRRTSEPEPSPIASRARSAERLRASGSGRGWP